MAAFDYAKSAATAQRLLSKFGTVVTHTRAGDGTYDPSTGVVSSTPVIQAGIGVLLEYSAQDKGVRQAAGVQVLTSDRKLLLGPTGISLPPRPGDTIAFAAVTYSVVEVATLAPAGVAVLYELQVRR